MNEARSVSAAGPSVVELQDVSFAYGDIPVFEGVSFTVSAGEFVGLVGPNGSGKTTLFRLLLGLLEPASGSVRVFGEPPARVRQRIGYVPQHFQYDAAFPVLVSDVVLMGRLGNGPWRWRHGRADRTAAETALAEVDMLALAKRPFAALSGGQRQRVLIARALAAEPELLLLDEPTANIDVAVEHELSKLLHRLNRRMTILLVTHDVGFVGEHVQRVLCVSRRVAAHPTDAVCGVFMSALYGTSVRAVRHGEDAARREDGGCRSS